MYRHKYNMHDYRCIMYILYFKRPISAKVLVCPLYIKTKSSLYGDCEFK